MKPLDGIHIVEFAGLGPAPFAAMLLSDMGARVVRIRRAGAASTSGAFLERGRVNVELDLKSAAGTAEALKLLRDADALIEGFRPGKMEALGLGPREVAAINPRIVYGRMTGWGQTGPLAQSAGHDLNFLALTGLLGLLGPRDRPPPPPLNLISDFAGGGMYLAFGVVSALNQASRTGHGTIVDAAMIHGTTHLATFVHGWRASGLWHDERESNVLDGGAPFYRTYETKDGRYMAIGAIEPAFFRNALRVLGVDPGFLEMQSDRAAWPRMSAAIATAFADRTLEEWMILFEGIDACVSPVLSMDEAKQHPQMASYFTESSRKGEPVPAPRFVSLPLPPDQRQTSS